MVGTILGLYACKSLNLININHLVQKAVVFQVLMHCFRAWLHQSNSTGCIYEISEQFTWA